MLKITRTKTQHHIVFCADSTRWRFTKFDQSKLQEVFELLYEYQCTGLDPQQVKEALLNLHTANKTIWDLRSKKPRWIPVTEKMPKDGEQVLCWYEYFRYGNYNRLYQTYGIGYQFHGNWGGEVSNGHKCRVIAWMPLPEKPEEE